MTTPRAPLRQKAWRNAIPTPRRRAPSTKRNPCLFFLSFFFLPNLWRGANGIACFFLFLCYPRIFNLPSPLCPESHFIGSHFRVLEKCWAAGLSQAFHRTVSINRPLWSNGCDFCRAMSQCLHLPSPHHPCAASDPFSCWSKFVLQLEWC